MTCLLHALLLARAVSAAAFAPPRPTRCLALLPRRSIASSNPSAFTRNGGGGSDSDGYENGEAVGRSGQGNATEVPSSTPLRPAPTAFVSESKLSTFPLFTRRRLLHRHALASLLLPAAAPRLARAADSDWADQQNWRGLGLFSRRWTPFANVHRWDTPEKCLLEMLPVTNAVFRQLQRGLEELEAHPPGDARGWRGTLLDVLAVLALLDAKRGVLDPVLAPGDALATSAAKEDLGRRNLVALRAALRELADAASGDVDLAAVVAEGAGARRDGASDDLDLTGAGEIDGAAFAAAQRRALRALAEAGELLVPAFPYAVPARGKFGSLPRLLGRCSVTFCFERPAPSSSAFGMRLGGPDAQQLGNVTIIADGYAAPITAGNFVDLSARQFYTGLAVKTARKRLGAVPTSSDNVIVNDLRQMSDTALDFGESVRGLFGAEPSEDVCNAIPILGSFQEGFYDPLTAKPRRIPLEIVTCGQSGGTLTYSSSCASLDAAEVGATISRVLETSSSPQKSFSSSISAASSDSTAANATFANFEPALSFNIPGLVALNHPDTAANSGSSEFFALPQQYISKKRAKLLDGQYAPFGYIVSGWDVYQSLKPGDLIAATDVSELGLMNLVKIRKNAFENGEDVKIDEIDKNDAEQKQES